MSRMLLTLTIQRTVEFESGKDADTEYDEYNAKTDKLIKKLETDGWSVSVEDESEE